MSKKDDQSQERLNQEKMNREAAQEKRAREEEEEIKRKKAMLQAEKNENEELSSEELENQRNVQLVPSKSKDDTEALIEDYNKRYPDKALNEENRVMRFDTEQEMLDFFTEHALAGKQFLAAEIDDNGNLTGQYIYSIGNGKFYSGTAQEVENKLLSDQKDTTDPEKKQKIADGLTRFREMTNRQTHSLKERLRQITPQERPSKTEEQKSTVKP